METTTRDAAVDANLDAILDAWRGDEPVRTSLPGGGVVRLDRRLPFLLVHRMRGEAGGGIPALLAGEASWAVLPSGAEAHDALGSALVRGLAEAAAQEFGAFMVLELWEAAEPEAAFVVHGPEGPASSTVESLREGLLRLDRLRRERPVRVDLDDERGPPGVPPLLTIRESWELGCLLVGLELPPVYRDPRSGTTYPVYVRRLRAALSAVIRKAVFEFVRVQTSAGIEEYTVLGTSRVDRAAWDADEALAGIERCYDLLLLLSPVDVEDAWSRFRDAGYDEEPEFHQHLLPVDPDLLKRRLFALELEEVHDPALGFLLRDKREELDRQISLLADRGSPAFLFDSMALYGAPEPGLVRVAEALLQALPPEAPGDDATAVGAAGFERRAAAELEHYRAAWPELGSRVVIRPDVVSLMVSRGELLIPEGVRLRPERVEPLIHHEVGTHVLTYWNGAAQPLRQLASGLAHYDELQEGLAVFAEYLVGGLTRRRMRVLAARVLAVEALRRGAGFVDAFRLLRREHGFEPREAFDTCARIWPGGGLTRDMIYLRGLMRLLEHLADGGELEPLYVGKVALKHMAAVAELRARGVLREPPLRPRFLDLPGVADRLAAARAGMDLLGLIDSEAA